MPLKPGKKDVGKNIRELEATGRPYKQSLAIALSVLDHEKTKNDRAKHSAGSRHGARR